jgi:hypothetical protein
MTGGLMQLVAVGSQDIYLTGNPQITFFKTVYRRHTNFSIESIEQILKGTVDFGQKVSCVLSRNGDLVHKVYLQVKLPALSNTSSKWVNNIGHILIKEISIEIGGQVIDKHYGDWLNIWTELTQTAERAAGYDKMIGATLENSGSTLYIPLQFWFCRNAGLALPLIALQYHDVKFNIEFRKASDCYYGTATTPEITDASLYVDYIYLDTDERKEFTNSSQEYLIDQLQFSAEEVYTTTTIKSKLSFNHPCKEFIWVLHSEERELAKEWSDYSSDGNSGQTLIDASLQLNGHERFSRRNGEYFNLVQPYQHHTCVPSSGIYVYSFSLTPEEHQPSGSINMSRIDTAIMSLTTNLSGSYKLRVYARNYNVLRISSGMGGLAYSN